MFIGKLLLALAITCGAILLLCGLLHLLPRLGAMGKRLSNALCYAPGLDGVVTCIIALPLVLGPMFAGWAGLFGAVLGQYTALALWTIIHEAAHPDIRKGPRLLKVHHSLIGVTRNLAALWLTSLSAPIFWLIRVLEIFIYPPLTWLTNLPSYRQSEWVSVSRHKFTGLIGHDRIWCLYCDWMTGVWSFGSEILRNVESFWCPIRFRDDLKCANCSVDFPDVAHWTDAHSDIGTATALTAHKYLDQPRPPANAWFGHPVRLTVKGKEVS